MISSRLLFFSHAVTVSVSSVFNSSGETQNLRIVPSAGEDPQKKNLHLISTYKTSASHFWKRTKRRGQMKSVHTRQDRFNFKNNDNLAILKFNVSKL